MSSSERSLSSGRARSSSSQHSVGSKRPREQPSDTWVTIHIEEPQEGRVVMYKIQPGAPMKLLLREFCKDKNHDYRTVRFVHNGKNIKSYKTPAQLGLQDEDVIFAWLDTQSG